MYKTYARMEGGDPSFAAVHLNGTPAETFWHEDYDTIDEFPFLWEHILDADRKGFTMVAGSKGQGEEKKAGGVISGHAYSVISIHVFEQGGEQVRLLKMRNPWG